MHGGDEMAHLETIKDRLHHIPYIQMLDGSRRCPSANALDVACAKQAKVIGFASI